MQGNQKNKEYLCKAKCSNGSACLNYAKYNGFCCKHKDRAIKACANDKKSIE